MKRAVTEEYLLVGFYPRLPAEFIMFIAVERGTMYCERPNSGLSIPSLQTVLQEHIFHSEDKKHLPLVSNSTGTNSNTHNKKLHASSLRRIRTKPRYSRTIPGFSSDAAQATRKWIIWNMRIAVSGWR